MTPGYFPAWSSATAIVLCLVYVASHQTGAMKATIRTPRSANSAPRITRHPVPEIAFRVGEDVTLTCIATSDIDITYSWKKDGQPLTLVVGGKIEGRQNEGSIVIRLPNSTDEGVYQCSARTDFGTALSTKTTLKAAVLESFLTVLNPLVHRPLVGQPLNLSCNPPKNYPTGKIYWGMSAMGSTSSKLDGIDNNDRILLDYNGRLYFANVIPEDSFEQIDRHLFYVCVVHNKLLGKFVKGNEQKVAPVAVAAENMRNHAPQAMWTSPAQDKAIRGQNKRLKCIFSGLPTPMVTWRRLDVEMSSRVNVTPEGHHTEIEIQKVDYSDAGLYECTATNSEGVSSRTLRLAVESAPYWRQNKVPADVEVIEDDPAEIECLADGSPRPTIEWYIDGVPIHETVPDERRTVTGNRINYDKITIETDKHVFQCSATNEHGQMLANMALNIQAFQPSFLDTPMDAKVVQGRNATLQCRAAGAPRPSITWIRTSTNSTIQDHRFSQLSNGNLEIKNAILDDTDTYECRIRNKFREDKVAARLLVRRPTVITKSPQDQTANVTDDVTLQCDVTTDAAEMEHLRVFWKKNEDRIDFARDDRLRMDPINNSLIIRSAEIDDTAVYTCHADNGLDTANSGAAILTVKGPPQPPTDVQVRHCSMHVASVTWRPASDNNDPINEYIVYYNRSHDPSGQVTEAARVAAPLGVTPPMELSTSVRVHPWATYTFFVVAVNSMGPGLPSQVSDVCITPQTTPSHNPSGVCSKLLGPKQLTIVWEAVPREQMNGEGFHYIVGYRLRGGKGHQQEVKLIRDPSQTELVIHDQENFRSYEIYVQSANNIGATPLSSSSKRIGYSGEGKPTVIPQGVTFNGKSLNSTFVELSWNSVDTSEDKMNGFFRGYRIQFWRTDKPEEKRTEDIILRPHFDSCPLLSREVDLERIGRRRRQHDASSEVVTGFTNRLWPNSRTQAGVMALNQANQGNLSQIVEFQTPEGVPGAVSSLEVTQVGSNHLLVEWTPPLDENGILTSYILTYQIAPPHQGIVRRRILPSTKHFFKILDLTPSTSYAVSLSAVTSAGQGQVLSTVGQTLPQAAPSKPEISDVDVGDTSVNVSWIPSGKEEPGNPGGKFYVAYRDRDDTDGGKWNQTNSITEENWANVTGLVSGRTYEIRVVSVNGLNYNEQETNSEIITVYIPLEGERTTTAPKEEMLIVRRGDAAVWWFIILMCIIILLLIILFIICAIYRSRGQMYPVYEKERLWGNPHKADDQPFGEYARDDPPLRATELRKSRGSLESDQKPLDSDSTDSLGDYDDADPSKFNEDGSFIGIYNTKTRSAPSSARASKRRAAAENGRPANTYV